MTERRIENCSPHQLALGGYLNRPGGLASPLSDVFGNQCQKLFTATTRTRHPLAYPIYRVHAAKHWATLRCPLDQ
ncbi:hypothetical protein Mal15_32670 [Stieleria maiorica]|uniref:Uncharacterized protein n=1 Tax=Stieleria maiorica TaxID=2795974 RepID=A0A5B9MGH2_9BACT|nr:hypothetical protein Mal15_32670 [Stieleria maiorica]